MAHRILMVDDEEAVVLATKLYLEAEGYEVLAAYDGAQALKLLDDPANRPDLILLDVYMPRLSGWDVLRMLRSDEAHRGIPVVMLTAADRDADMARGWDLGVDWYQTKPFNPNELLAIIARVLQSAEEEARERALRRPSP